MSETHGLRPGAVLRLAFGASRRNGTLLLPLMLAELCAGLLGLIPALVIVLPLYRAAMSATTDPFLLFAAVTDPGLWSVYGVGLLLAAAGAWLLRTLARTGVIGTIAAELSGAPRRSEPFAATLLDRPDRWLVAGAFAGILRFFAFVCGLGSVVASMVWFRTSPGVGPALAMTLSTILLISVPLLDAALGVGFVRAVTGKQGPIVSLGEGTLLAFRRARTVLPIWYLFVMFALVVALVPSGGAAAIAAGALPPVAAAIADALAWAVAAALAAVVVLGRLASWVVIVAEDEGHIAVVEARDTSGLRVVDAVAVDEQPTPA